MSDDNVSAQLPRPSRYQPVPFEYRRMDEEEQLAASRRFLETMARRRTIREYSSELVPFALIKNAIRAASLAPSGAKQQPWTFVVVSDPALKREIRLAAEEEERESGRYRRWHVAFQSCPCRSGDAHAHAQPDGLPREAFTPTAQRAGLCPHPRRLSRSRRDRPNDQQKNAR